MITKEMIFRAIKKQFTTEAVLYPVGGYIDPTAGEGDTYLSIDGTLDLEELAEDLNKEQNNG